MSCKIKKRSKTASGDWLCLEKIEYLDASGKNRDWESVMRVNGRGAVAILAILKPSERIILVRQFRPPANGYVIEFPAGLVDAGESPEEAAVRELREETGYNSVVIDVMPPMFSSPGFSGETLSLVRVEVDENAPENQNLITEFDESEDIETFPVKSSELSQFLKERELLGDLMDSKVLIYMLGMC